MFKGKALGGRGDYYKGHWGRLSQGPLTNHIRNLYSSVTAYLSRAGTHGKD